MTPSGPEPQASEGAGRALHATCVVLDETGLLILGDSGAGKSTLALMLVDRWRRAGRFARLVADDRTLLWTAGGRIVARPHPQIAGRHELRGVGIRQGSHMEAAVVRGAVWCEAGDAARFPEPAVAKWRHGDMALPMIRVGRNHQRELLVMAFLADTGLSVDSSSLSS